MNEIQLETKRRVSVLFDERAEPNDALDEAETLLHQADEQSFCSDLLQFFVHTQFEEQEAQEHWRKIFENYDYLASELNRDVGLRVAIFDYFVNLHKAIANPIMIEMRVFKETEKLAMLDALTSMFNRRYLEIGLKREIMRSQRYSSDLSLLMIDLDDFKHINDTRGHLVGDEVLKKMAEIVVSISREEDIPCRYGGEEFVVILPQTNSGGALTFAERLRSEVQTDAFLREYSMTFSGGITSYPEGGKNSQELLKDADKAMYKAKFSGKNCCVVSTNCEAESNNAEV